MSSCWSVRRACKAVVSGMSECGVQQKDTTFTKIFVGGLPYHTTDKSLRQFFESFGDIEEAVVITDRQTGKSRGYGFARISEVSVGALGRLPKAVGAAVGVTGADEDDDDDDERISVRSLVYNPTSIPAESPSLRADLDLTICRLYQQPHEGAKHQVPEHATVECIQDCSYK
ncbi:hypothetical protein HPB51_014274 [Rhipicephalus microplus]|uniref:RRM domain-containing protein n=1 Tax=Rhipicephalus microplus TaxID=6941 RepID=A0A9J6DUM5_RHIMP|nr:hypothetical protein HPB51_014274 [Rhipicephalus microplus]